MTVYVIEKGVPIPPVVAGRKKGTQNGSGLLSAMKRLEVGDSMIIKPIDQASTTATAKRLGMIVTGRKVDGRVRVWRVA